MSTLTPNNLQQRLNDLKDNPHLITFYANSKCKDCLGRGKRQLSVRNEATGFQWVEVEQQCPCVLKAIKKEVKELEKSDG